ncbi:sulfurtransferase [Paraglaciecola sp. 2405UD69-4]|uniref:sulfurtransferase n=1 Tax=Paraglaciecola sp. 2405UD69-4 TaxID=3391836 RepID=UPI0039C9B31A
MKNNNLVSTEWLQDHLVDENIVVLYTQMDNPVTGEKDTPPLGYIPNSVFFDFETVFCDTESKWPHTMLSETRFSQELGKLGLCSDCLVVVYDNKGIYSSPRVWWMLRSMGFEQVYVLDGGLPKWLKEGRDFHKSLSTRKPVKQVSVSQNSGFFISAENILKDHHSLQILDARSQGRFYGTAPEPREGLRSGHAPGAINLPFTDLVDGAELKSTAELTSIFESLNLALDEQLVFSCGSGVTACILALAASQVGYQNLVVYDGSWAEWGAREELPVVLN